MEQNEIYAALPGVLLPWYEKNARDLPWRHTKEPYRVWVSEIMLQQTRVEAVIGYYERFMEAFPTVQALAEADEARVLKLWEGLGYYSRARNLQKTAKLLTETQNGAFPDTAEALEKLPGIGAYTAGAVASICFEQPAAAVVVVGVDLQVLSELLDAGGENGDLHLGGAGVSGMGAVGLDHGRLFVFTDHGEIPPFFFAAHGAA